MIHAFNYRNPRLAARLPVEFLTDSGVLSGVTVDISEKGLFADFGEPVAPKTSGHVRFRIGRCSVELAGEATHTSGFRTGLAFLFTSDQEAIFLRALLQALAQSQAPEAQQV